MITNVHGVTTLFAALDVATGKVVGQCMKQHRHQEWLKFLRAIDRATPKGLDLHLIADNYATHKHPTVKAWLAKHTRFHLHFTPISASWLNQIERFFGLITDKAHPARRVQKRRRTGERYHGLPQSAQRPTQAVRVIKSAGEILEKVARGKQALESVH